MAKRFTDSEKWNDDWYISLNNDQKVAWQWIIDNCNHGGLCKRSMKLLNFYCNSNFVEEDIINFADGRIYIYKDYWFIPKFLIFQYGNNWINSSGKPVLSAIKNLLEVGILVEQEGKYVFNQTDFFKELSVINIPLTNTKQTQSIPYDKGYTTPMDMDMDMNMDMNKEMDNTNGLAYDERHKDFDKFVLTFPQGKRNYDPHSLTIWENLSQRDKDICIQLTPHYVDFQIRSGKEQYIKNVKKFLEDGFYKQLFEFQSRYLGKKVLLKENSETLKTKEEQLEEEWKKMWGD